VDEDRCVAFSIDCRREADFFSRCVGGLLEFSYGNYTWKNTFGKRGGGVLVVSNRTPTQT
jgi:hypothetical protein